MGAPTPNQCFHPDRWSVQFLYLAASGFPLVRHFVCIILLAVVVPRFLSPYSLPPFWKNFHICPNSMDKFDHVICCLPGSSPNSPPCWNPRRPSERGWQIMVHVLHYNSVKFPKDVFLYCSVHQHGCCDVKWKPSIAYVSVFFSPGDEPKWRQFFG